MKKIISIFILILLIIGCISALFACAPQDTSTPSISYIVSFNTNGGSAIKSITLKSGSQLNLPDNPIREGYVFTGWFLDKDCEREVNLAVFRVVSNTTIFAGWESVETYRHHVIFDENIKNGTLKVISPEDGRASFGTEVQVSVTPDEGYQLVEGTLKANGVDLEYVSAQLYKFTMPKSSVQLTCSFDLSPIPIILLNNFSNGLLVLSKDNARPGEYVSVQAIPDYGYRLTELYIVNNSLDLSTGEVKISILNSGSFYMGTDNTFVGAVFEEIDYNKEYNVNISSSNGGKVVASSTSMPAGLFVNLDFIPDEGYRLTNYIITGEKWTTIIKADKEGFIMPSENVNITAHFAQITDEDPSYEISINQPVNGQVSLKAGSGNYHKKGEIIELQVQPNEGYVLKNLAVNGVSVVGNTFVMPEENATITAEFVQKGHKIDILSYNCEIILTQLTAYEGDVVYFDIIEHEGYNVSPNSITLDGIKITDNYFIMPAKDVVLSATAYSTNVKYEVRIGDLEGGVITASTNSANIYEKVDLQILPSEGLRLKADTLQITYYRQGVEKTEHLRESSFIMPDASVIISAEFEKVYKVSALEGDKVSIYPNVSEASVGEIIWFDVVTHGNVILNSVRARVNFGNYSEVLNSASNFLLTTEKLSSAGAYPSISLTIEGYEETNANRTYPINVKSVSGGEVIVDGSSYGQYGEIIRLKVKEYAGFELSTLYLSTNSGDYYPVSDTFIMPNSTVTITPTFKIKEENSFSLGARYLANLNNFKNANIRLEYFRETYQLIDKYPSIKSNPFINYIVGAVKVDAITGHDFYIIEVNEVNKVNPIAHNAHDFIASSLNIDKGDVEVYINYNYVILSVGGNPVEDFYVYKNGINVVGDFIIYERQDGTYGLFSYIGKGGYVSMLSQYNERSISYLSSGAFSDPQGILGINLSNIKEIDDFALENTNISSVDLKDVQILGEGVFKDCKNLKSFTVSTLNESFSVKDGVLYLKNKNNTYATLYAYPINKENNGTFSMPSQTSAIASFAFYNTNLTTVSYGGALTTIGDYAFAYSKLESLKYTSASAISGVVDFSTSNVNKSAVSVLGDGVFKGCDALNAFYLDSIIEMGEEVIVWDGNSTIVISLSTNGNTGVVKIIDNPIVIPTTQSGTLVINVSSSLRDMYNVTPEWAKYYKYFKYI